MVQVHVDWARVATSLLATGLSSLIVYFMMKGLYQYMDPSHAKSQQAAAKGQAVLKRLKKKGVRLTEHEGMIAADIVDPGDIAESFANVGGLDQTIAVLRQEVVLPMTQPELYQSSKLLAPPKGVLLFGPPGCGKTLLARALAKESGCCFINVRPTSFMDKWYGESNKLVEAIFSLATKLSPSIVFIDEIDAFLSARSSTDHESSALVKAQFLSNWDGFVQQKGARVVVVGATNRPAAVDQAILRRLTRTCHIGLPDESQRQRILAVILREEKLEKQVTHARLATLTPGFSGSDLQELCRLAANEALRSGRARPDPQALPPLAWQDFEAAKQAVECATSEGVPMRPLASLGME